MRNSINSLQLAKTIVGAGLVALTTACMAPAQPAQPTQPQTQQIQQVIVVVTATPQATQSAPVAIEPTGLPTVVVPTVAVPTVAVPTVAVVPTAAPLPSATPEGGSVQPPAPTETPVPPTLVPTDSPTEVPTVAATNTPMVLQPLPTLIVPIVPLVKFGAADQSLIKSQCTTLTWKAMLMKSVEINGVNKPLQGSEKICPSDTTNYTLVATTKAGKQVIKSVEVKVIPLILTKIVVPVKPIKPLLPKP